QVSFFHRSELARVLERIKPSVIVLQHWGLAYALPEPLPCPLVIDLAGPHLLERKFWGNQNAAHDLQEKLSALQRADFITCSGEKQKHYFYPFLREAGFTISLEDIPVIPFSAPRDPIVASRQEPNPLTFVYGGAFLAWHIP